jgi:hypothetical protein
MDTGVGGRRVTEVGAQEGPDTLRAPHRCGCMMSSRVASLWEVGLAEEEQPITSGGTASGSELDENPSARNGTLASGTMTGRRGRCHGDRR